MPTITLPDSSERHFEAPVSGADIATHIGKRLAKDAVCMRIDGGLYDLYTMVAEDTAVEIVTRDSPEGLELLRDVLATRFGAGRLCGQLELGPGDGRVRGWLHEHNAVVAEQVSEQGGWRLDVEVDEAAWRAFAERAGMRPERLRPQPRSRLAASS